MYFGERTEAVPYFSMLGYTCPDTFSPADYLIDLLAIRPGIEAACLDRVVVRKQMKKLDWFLILNSCGQGIFSMVACVLFSPDL